MQSQDQDRVAAFMDAVLGDLAVRSAMHVGRRRQDGDADTCVIQTGEDGRHRLTLPERDSSPSIERFAREAQAHLATVLEAPVPRCPLHDHALVGFVDEGRFVWRCPHGDWQCALGDYEENTWPQLDVPDKLAPILSRRLDRRGLAFRSLGVRRAENALVVEVGLPELTAELVEGIREAAAPLSVSFHRDSRQPIRLAASPSAWRLRSR